MEQLLVALVVAWAAWHVHGALAPWQQRRWRAALTRRLAGVLPAWLLQRLRPGPPATGCGCAGGNACEDRGRSLPGR